MISRRNWALVIHGIPTLGLMVQGLLYVTTSEFMPYHSDAVGAAWGDLPPNYQGFFLGVLRGMGAGSIGVTLAIAFILLIPFRRGDRWALWAVPAIGVVFTALTAYAAFTIDVRTPAAPPWRQTLGLTAMYVAGGLTTLWPERARVSALGMLFFSAAAADAQELEPRAFSPSPVGTTFVLSGFGRSEGGFSSIHRWTSQTSRQTSGSRRPASATRSGWRAVRRGSSPFFRLPGAPLPAM